jgi:hypothetical protein
MGLTPRNIDEVLLRYPRTDFKRQLIDLMRAEARAVPGGRLPRVRGLRTVVRYQSRNPSVASDRDA